MDTVTLELDRRHDFLVSGNRLYDIAKTGVVAYAKQFDYSRRQVVVASRDGRERVVSCSSPGQGSSAWSMQPAPFRPRVWQ